MEPAEEFGKKLDMMKTIADDKFKEQGKKPSKFGFYIKLVLIIVFSIAAVIVWLNFFRII